MEIQENGKKQGEGWKAPKKEAEPIEEIAMGDVEDEENVDITEEAPYTELNLGGKLNYRGEQAGGEAVAAELARKAAEKPKDAQPATEKLSAGEKAVATKRMAQEAGIKSRERAAAKGKAEAIMELANLEGDAEATADYKAGLQEELDITQKRLAELREMDEIPKAFVTEYNDLINDEVKLQSALDSVAALEAEQVGEVKEAANG